MLERVLDGELGGQRPSVAEPWANGLTFLGFSYIISMMEDGFQVL